MKPTNCNIIYVNEVINNQDNEWNIEILRNIVTDQELHEILKIFINNNQHEDKIIWNNDKKVSLYG